VVTDAQNLMTTTQVRLTVSAPPALTITASPGVTLAQGGSLTLTAAGAATYLWSTSDTTAVITPQTATTGSTVFSVTGVAASGCTATASVSVLVSGTAVGGSAPGSVVSFGDADRFGVTVLGNPTESETVDVVLRGTNRQPITLRVLTAQGTLVSQQELQPAEQVSKQRIRLGNTPGLYFLQFITPTQTSVLKISRL
jgi:hypothetical protein